MNTLYVIIVTYNVGPEFGALLDRLVLESQRIDSTVQILLVDNASPDPGTQKILSDWENRAMFHVIRNGKNRGFAAGCNIGITYALSHHADTVLLLNPDTEIQNGFFRQMCNTTADISAPVIRFRRNGRWIYDYGGTVNTWTGQTRHKEHSVLASPKSRRSRKIAVNPNGIVASQTPVDDVTDSIDYVSGCCMMIRKNVIDKIGFFDERYFLYFEDVDFCQRAKKAGLDMSVVPSCVVTHTLKEGGQKSRQKHRAHLVSARMYIQVWVPWYRRALAYGYWILLLLKTVTGALYFKVR